VYVESGSDIEREIYLSLTLNRERGRIALIASAAGGMDIEEVAAKTPEQILTVNIHPAAGLQGYQCRQLAFGLGLKGTQGHRVPGHAMGLYKLYLEKDASLVEVNPLIVTKSGSLMALDAKINIDANAVFRPSGHRQAARRETRKIRWSVVPASTISTTFRSMATSHAWSTAQDLRWRPWTSSSCMAASRPLPGRGRWRDQ